MSADDFMYCYVLLCMVGLDSVGYATVVSIVEIEFSMASIVSNALGPPFPPWPPTFFFFSGAINVTA